MSKRYFFTLSDEQADLFEGFMNDGVFPDATAYMSAMLAAEKARKEEIANRRGPGRPRNDEMDAPDGDDIEANYEDDMPKNIPHFGRFIGPREYADIIKVSQEMASRFGKKDL